MDIQTGISHTVSTVVDSGNVASAVGSGLVEVFATPMMIALLERAAAACIQGYLAPGQASVGTVVNVAHSGATPIGMSVSATATVAAIDRRRVDFDIIVVDEVGEVGRGTHSRFVIDRDAFMQKVAAKKSV